MLEKIPNKMQKRDTIKEEEIKKQSFFFPEYGITIEANSIEEAQVKLLEIINKK